MYGHMYAVVYLTHFKKRGFSKVTAHTINKWELVSSQDTVDVLTLWIAQTHAQFAYFHVA